MLGERLILRKQGSRQELSYSAFLDGTTPDPRAVRIRKGETKREKLANKFKV